jgi:hypothetical protein
MHDLDRAMFEVGEFEGFELGTPGETQELEHEDFLGVLGSLLGKEVSETQETQELQEVELASELLEVSSEAELDRFIGDLLKRAAGAVGNFARSDNGRALGGILKQAASKALPVVGRAVGAWVKPNGGGQAGARVAKAAGNLFGLELEGLSAEDREFELARGFVRFASAAARNAAAAPQGAPPAAVAKAAAASAARQHAPGLLGPGAAAGGQPGRPSSGRWTRQGRAIVIYDA